MEKFIVRITHTFPWLLCWCSYIRCLLTDLTRFVPLQSLFRLDCLGVARCTLSREVGALLVLETRCGWLEGGLCCREGRSTIAPNCRLLLYS